MFDIVSLYSSKFLVCKTFTMGIKTKNLSRMTRLCLWSFYKGVLKDDPFSKLTTLEWSQEWSFYTGLSGGCWKRMGNFFRGGRGGLQFLQKNKLKSEIFNDKKSL